jgi:hypothetical protein
MQSWLLLVARLSEEEEQELEIEHVPEPEPESEAIEEPEEPSADGQVPDVAADEEPEAPSPPPVPGPITFGAYSETPGAVIPGDGEIRVVLEGFLLPRNITLPLEVVAGVVSGLEELDMLHRQQGRVDPILLCDRADCAVYGRVGTRTRPDAVELRVWTGPATSEAIAIEAQHLRQTLAALGLSTLELQSSAQRDEDREYTGQGVIPSSDAFFQAEFESQAPTEPTREKAPAAVAPHSIPLEWIELGYRQVLLSLRRSGESRRLALQWDANTLELPVEHLEEMLTDIRGLYYDALRGRRGHALEVGRHPTVTISVHNQGPQMYVVFEHQIDGERTSLAVPAGEVPAFLNALRSALVSH